MKRLLSHLCFSVYVLLVFVAFPLAADNEPLINEPAPPQPVLSPTPMVLPTPSVLISDVNQKCDESFGACVLGASRGRVANLMQLHLAQVRVQDRFSSLQQRVEANPDMSHVAYSELLETLWKEVDGDIKALSANLRGSDEIKNLANAELHRLKSEVAVRLSLASISSAATPEESEKLVKKYADLGELWADQSLQTLEKVSADRREILAPRLLARIAMTRVSVEQVRMHMAKASGIESFDAFKTVLDRYKASSDQIQESTWLDLVRAESFVSIASAHSGSGASLVRLDPARMEKIEELRKRLLDAGANGVEDAILKSRATELAHEIPFYIEGNGARGEHLGFLQAQLQTAPEAERESIRQALSDVAAHNDGTALGQQLTEMAERDSSLEAMMESSIESHKERGRAYDQAYRQAVGDESYEKLGFASFDEVMKSNGSIQDAQENYVQSLSKFSQAFEAYQLDPKNTDTENLKAVMEEVDFLKSHIRSYQKQAPSGSCMGRGRVRF